jgi:predicted ATPase/class 3 adenylate cyclase
VTRRPRPARDLPTGTVTFLFTDVEGSTRLLHEFGAERYAGALADHRLILRESFTRHGGIEVDTQGDAFFVAFPTADGAVRAAAEACERLASSRIRVRIGIHTGTPLVGEEGYIGADIHRAARIAAAGHGGQVLVSKETRDLVDVELTDLGEHRLKDFHAPVAIYQLGSEPFPPLKTISNTNLPRPASSFLGRDREVAELGALLRDGARLLTLTGPGGSGKTRLAIEAAAELVPAFKAGVFWIGLSALRDPALVAPTVAQTLGASETLAEHIGDRELLLLLDNLEQVVGVGRDLATLVETCPNLRLLVTSRELLRVRGEIEYHVAPLEHRDAIELFCSRAGVVPDPAVDRLCRVLDDLPLALELAAARARVLSPAQILERLSSRLDLLKGGRDADPRQQTLRATIEWSHDLLQDHEARLFERLAVFRGGCTLEAAEQIADADLDTLQSLVDKSLVRHRDGRYWMLETVREFAAERLGISGKKDPLHHLHAEHFLTLAETAEPHLRGSPKEWGDRIESEHDNIRSALDTLEASADVELALRMAGSIAPFWYLRNHVLEGRRRLENALSRAERPTAARAKALVGLATMAFGEADLEEARRRAKEALDLYQQLGDRSGAAYAAMVLGNAFGEAQVPDDTATAQRLLEESVQAFREVGDIELELRATYNLAVVSQDLGEDDRARALLEDILRRARALRLERDQSMALGALSGFARRAGRIVDAVSMLAESIRIERELGDLAWTANNLGRLAEALALAGNGATSAQVLGCAEALHEQLGLKWPLWVNEMNDETRTLVRAQLDEAAFTDAFERGWRASIDEVVEHAVDSIGSGAVVADNWAVSGG